MGLDRGGLYAINASGIGMKAIIIEFKIEIE
jgi:hypothetical protein